jgi:hypothetical protein
MFKSLGSTLGGLFDSNPQKTLQDNRAKLSVSVDQVRPPPSLPT